MSYVDIVRSDEQTESLNALRLQNLFIDITISIGDKQFPAHKIVLASMCDFFKAMFTSNFKEKNSSTVKISDQFVNAEIFEEIIEYCYTRKINITEENVFNLFEASNYLALENIKNATIKFIYKIFKNDILFKVFSLAVKYDSCELFQHCWLLMNLKSYELMSDKYFITYENEEFYYFLKCFGKYSIFVEDCLKIISKWIKADYFIRRKFLESLLDCICLKFIYQETFEEFLIELNIDYRVDLSIKKYMLCVQFKTPQNSYIFEGREKTIGEPESLHEICFLNKQTGLEGLDHFEEDLDLYQVSE